MEFGMSYTEMKNTILFRYHKDINFWYRLLGEMFEKSNGFSESGIITRKLDGEKRTITWKDYSWSIE